MPRPASSTAAPQHLPVDENHPVAPPDANGVSKFAGEQYWMLEHRVQGRPVVSLRLTNCYGPRLRIRDARQTFLGIWIRCVLEGKPFEVWGGAQTRDMTYVDDVTEAFLLAAERPECHGRIFNIGGSPPASLLELAELVVRDRRPRRTLRDAGVPRRTRDHRHRQLLCRRHGVPRGDRLDAVGQPGGGHPPFAGLVPSARRGVSVMIPQADPGAGYRAHAAEIDAAVARALGSGWYILGPRGAPSRALSPRWLGAAHAVGCGNGTDALALALRALGVGPGAAVATVSHTAVATVAAIEMAGATFRC